MRPTKGLPAAACFFRLIPANHIKAFFAQAALNKLAVNRVDLVVVERARHCASRAANGRTRRAGPQDLAAAPADQRSHGRRHTRCGCAFARPLADFIASLSRRQTRLLCPRHTTIDLGLGPCIPHAGERGIGVQHGFGRWAARASGGAACE